MYFKHYFNLSVLTIMFIVFSGCGSGNSLANNTAISTIENQNNVALGLISDALVTILSLEGEQLFQTHSGTFDQKNDLNDDNQTLVAFSDQKVGKFSVRLPSNIDLEQLLLVKIEGGVDIDPDGDGMVDPSKFRTINGILYAYVKASDLLNGDVTVNVFTTIAAEFIMQQGLKEQLEITSVLKHISQLLFQESEGNPPLYCFNPALLDTEKNIIDSVMLLNSSTLYKQLLSTNMVSEIYTGLPHSLLDSDNDGLYDDFELMLGSQINLKNSDGDALNDYGEVFASLNPNISDTQTNEDTLYPYQWYLENTGQDAGSASGGTLGNDINVKSIWEEYSGRRDIYVGVVDSGIEALHPDLTSNLDLNRSIRYSDSSNDPSPSALQLLTSPYISAHGTACAGLIAGQGWNSKGVRGVAPFTKLVGYNVFSSPLESNFLNALSQEIDISSNSWGYGSEVLTTDPLLVSTLRSASINGRDGKGTLFVFAAGNDRDTVIQDRVGQEYRIGNANNAQILNNPYVITVAATDADGHYSSYSNFGSNILVSAPGGEFGVEKPAIVTTDLTGLQYGFDSYGFARDYRNDIRFNVEGNEDGNSTNYMNGTSSSTPIVSGVIALMLNANPRLTYRDIKYILAITAQQNDPSDAGWSINGAGYHINHNYGFGLVNTTNAISQAEGFVLLGTQKTTDIITVESNTPIPDNDQIGVISSIDVPVSLLAEHVDVWVNIPDHTFPGDLDITLVSPLGTKSRLAYGGGYYLEGSYANWRFSTVRCLDENIQGTWKLIVKDLAALDNGTLKSWSLQINGR